MVKIIFETHGTSLDNESGLSSGHHDTDLSKLGEGQARSLGLRYSNTKFSAVFVSDLKRAYRTAEIAFAGRNDIRIIKDPRLRECNYGDLNHHPDIEVAPKKLEHISVPFPRGESYEQSNERIKGFLEELLWNYEDRSVLIIDHQAVRYALECIVNKRTLQDLISESWKWQPGWTYKLKKI